ncbi:thiamine pyrophosphate-dependent enzyme [Streptomyces mirabilis]|uniref:thiamine pyrophosphate-dependent enzyme n=1 Tax=Streptomyces TaxID=1883 RepID=UPI003322C715
MSLGTLTPEDAVVSTYREHGHAPARGITAEAVMAEMYGTATGCSGGRGGSMHLFDAAVSTAAAPSSPAVSRWPRGAGVRVAGVDGVRRPSLGDTARACCRRGRDP